MTNSHSIFTMTTQPHPTCLAPCSYIKEWKSKLHLLSDSVNSTAKEIRCSHTCTYFCLLVTYTFYVFFQKSPVFTQAPIKIYFVTSLTNTLQIFRETHLMMRTQVMSSTASFTHQRGLDITLNWKHSTLFGKCWKDQKCLIRGRYNCTYKQLKFLIIFSS